MMYFSRAAAYVLVCVLVVASNHPFTFPSQSLALLSGAAAGAHAAGPCGMRRPCPLRLRGGGRLYVTRADLIRAGIDPDFDPETWEYENWGAVQRSKKEVVDLPEPLWSWHTEPAAEPGDDSDELSPLQHASILAQNERMYHPREDLKKNQLVDVLGIAFDGTFDNETTTIMQLRLAIERADFHALRRALHNAAELPFWTERLDEAFNIARRVLPELYGKEDSRFHLTYSPEQGRHWVVREDLFGTRVPIPPRLAETEPTDADLYMGPRDGATRLRIDPDMGMDENLALWDALESHHISTRVLPEIANLTFDDEAVETIYQAKAAAPPEAYYPTVLTPWPALKKLALERAEEAAEHGERGEVGSTWYRAERRRDCEYIHIYICVYIHIHIYMCIYTYTHTHTHVYVYVYVYV
jgi:hypothetical protein